MPELTWEQKLQALQALGPCALRMRRPGDWYVDTSISVKDGPMLCGRIGSGSSPTDAVLSQWERVTALKAGEYLVIYNPIRAAVKWNGFMWAHVDEEQQGKRIL